MTPIENILQAEMRTWVPDYIQAMRVIHEGRQAAKLTLVNYHKKQLGRQNRTWVGEYRYWIWHFGSWEIYVSNHKGVGFEVPEMANVRSALEGWEDYKERMGIK